MQDRPSLETDGLSQLWVDVQRIGIAAQAIESGLFWRGDLFVAKGGNNSFGSERGVTTRRGVAAESAHTPDDDRPLGFDEGSGVFEGGLRPNDDLGEPFQVIDSRNFC